MTTFQNLRIVIAGGSGFIGQHFSRRWSERNDVVILTRGMETTANNAYHRSSVPNGNSVEVWDGKSIGPWAKLLDGADLLINLAGKSVNCRYNAANRAEILNSRVDATRVLGRAVEAATNPPKLWINSSSATIYRHATDRPQDEETGEIKDDFSVQVCKSWEASFFERTTPQTRKVALRMAIVLGKGGVLIPYSRLARLGLGGKQGSGDQMFSWIHIDDLCRIVEWLWSNEAAEGVYNAAAPNPLPNRDFMTAVRQTLHVPFGLLAPAWMLKLGAALIGTETELLLKSRWVVPNRLKKEGFTFLFDKVMPALQALLQKD